MQFASNTVHELHTDPSWYLFEYMYATQKFDASLTQNATPTPFEETVLMLAVTLYTLLMTQRGEMVTESLYARFELILQFVAFCQARVAPASVEPIVPLLVSALVKESVTVGISRLLQQLPKGRLQMFQH